MDLFAEFDADNSGSVSREELREGLKRIASPPVRQSKVSSSMRRCDEADCGAQAAKLRQEIMEAAKSKSASHKKKQREWMIDPTGNLSSL